jgi:hypothetical protein
VAQHTDSTEVLLVFKVPYGVTAHEHMYVGGFTAVKQQSAPGATIGERHYGETSLPNFTEIYQEIWKMRLENHLG